MEVRRFEFASGGLCYLGAVSVVCFTLLLSTILEVAFLVHGDTSCGGVSRESQVWLCMGAELLRLTLGAGGCAWMV